MQWNKRDLPDVESVEVMDKLLNTRKVEAFEAVAIKGIGVYETLIAISKAVMMKMK